MTQTSYCIFVSLTYSDKIFWSNLDRWGISSIYCIQKSILDHFCEEQVYCKLLFREIKQKHVSWSCSLLKTEGGWKSEDHFSCRYNSSFHMSYWTNNSVPTLYNWNRHWLSSTNTMSRCNIYNRRNIKLYMPSLSNRNNNTMSGSNNKMSRNNNSVSGSNKTWRMHTLFKWRHCQHSFIIICFRYTTGCDGFYYCPCFSLFTFYWFLWLYIFNYLCYLIPLY